MKRYDADYFRRWYQGEDPPKSEAELRRAVALAVAVTESVTGEPVRTVLDVGCGEGRWQPILAEMRPGVEYLGLDPSAYAVERWGEERGLVRGGLETLRDLDLREPFDLVVCADVLHYLHDETVLIHLDELADLVGGTAFLEVFTAEDRGGPEGAAVAAPADASGVDPAADMAGFHPRPASWYRRVFAGAGLVPVGMQMYVHREIAGALDALELPPGELSLTPADGLQRD